MGQFEYFKRFLLKFEDLSIVIHLTPRPSLPHTLSFYTPFILKLQALEKITCSKSLACFFLTNSINFTSEKINTIPNFFVIRMPSASICDFLHWLQHNILHTLHTARHTCTRTS